MSASCASPRTVTAHALHLYCRGGMAVWHCGCGWRVQVPLMVPEAERTARMLNAVQGHLGEAEANARRWTAPHLNGTRLS